MRQAARRKMAELPHAPASAAAIRAVRKRFSKELADADRKTLLGVAYELIAHAPFGRLVAYELVRYHAPAMGSITRAEVEKLGRGMRGWGDVDTFSCYVAGPAWRAGRITDAAIRAWARSPDWRWRRTALVSTVPLNSAAQGGAGDTKRTLAICLMLAADREDLVVKAMSWALRELGKRDPAAVRRFLKENRLAARVVREVNNKLDTGLKNPKGGRRAH